MNIKIVDYVWQIKLTKLIQVTQSVDNTAVIALLPHTPRILKSSSLTTTNRIRFFNQPDTRRVEGRGKKRKNTEFLPPSNMPLCDVRSRAVILRRGNE